MDLDWKWTLLILSSTTSKVISGLQDKERSESVREIGKTNQEQEHQSSQESPSEDDDQIWIHTQHYHRFARRTRSVFQQSWKLFEFE